MNILLTTSAAPKKSPFSTSEKRFPLGIGFLISVLRNAGHKVFFLDNYLKPTHFYENDYLIKNKIDLVGIYANTICFEDSLRMFSSLEKLRRKGIWKGKIAVGGPHTSVAPETIPGYIDHLVQGEGEETIIQIANGCNDRIIKGERIKNLDSMPSPAWDCFVGLPYDISIEWLSETPVFPMNTSRGCPFPCTFCSVGSIWGNTYTMMSAEKIFDEVTDLQKRYNVRGIYFREDNFTLSKKRLESFCELLLKNNADIKWVCESRIDSLDNETLKMMHRAGCRALYLGIESGSERMLSFIKKNITVSDIKRVFNDCRKTGIKTAASVMIGLPTETVQERKETLKLLDEIKPDTSWINIFIGIPGSNLYNHILKNRTFIFKDKNQLLYLKNHNKLVDKYYRGKASAKIPSFSGRIKEGIENFFFKKNDL